MLIQDIHLSYSTVFSLTHKHTNQTDFILVFLFLQVQAIKLLVRWLLGMKNNQSKSANSTLRLLSAMLVSEGDLTEQKKIRYVWPTVIVLHHSLALSHV